MTRIRSRVLALTATAAMTLSIGSVTATAAPATVEAKTAAKPTENSKLNKVKTPRLGWFNCYGGAKCATAKVPLDYDSPKGKTTNVAVLRVPATGKRIGTLFVNPGGPGGSSTEMAYNADAWLSPAVRAKFDIVGVDPRGIGFSDQVQCLPVEQQDDIYKNLNVAFPYGYTQEQGFMSSMKKVAKACSKNSLATSMSTAEVARDMEMVRRSIGDGKLSYLGFSYGSHLGTTYANMFPGNFRSIAIDGTLDPTAWSGTKSNQSKPLDARLKSGAGASKALDKILTECGKVGPDKCSYADGGNPKTKFTQLAADLKKKPATVTDPWSGERFTVTYADLIGTLLGGLYDPAAPQATDWTLSDLQMMIDGDEMALGRAASPERRKAQKKVVAELKKDHTAPRRGFQYDNSLDAFLSVTCTDSKETTKIANYPKYAKDSDKTAPHFGRAWLWGSAGCAGDAFTGQDEDAYTGPYTRHTTKAVLIVGNYWDPATNYQGAVSTRATLGRSRLISSDSWGHTAYGVSKCATQKVDTYLISGTAPADTTCAAESEMFPDMDEEPQGEMSIQQLLKDRPLPKGKGKGFPTPVIVR